MDWEFDRLLYSSNKNAVNQTELKFLIAIQISNKFTDLRIIINCAF